MQLLPRSVPYQHAARLPWLRTLLAIGCLQVCASACIALVTVGLGAREGRAAVLDSIFGHTEAWAQAFDVSVNPALVFNSTYDPYVVSPTPMFGTSSSAFASAGTVSASASGKVIANVFGSSLGRGLVKSSGNGIYIDGYHPQASSSAGSSVGFQFFNPLGPASPVDLRIVWAKSTEYGSVSAPTELLDGGSSARLFGSASGTVGQNVINVGINTHSADYAPHKASATIVWSLGANPLPGTVPETANHGEIVIGDDFALFNATEFFSASVADYGVSTPIFFNLVMSDQTATEPTPVPLQSAFVAEVFAESSLVDALDAPTYHVSDGMFLAQTLAFTSITAPTALPVGDFYLLQFGEFEQQLGAGEVFHFPDLVDGGVFSFSLVGLGNTVGFDDPSLLPGYAVGLTFAEDGLAHFTFQTLSSAVPEPSSIVLLGMCLGSGYALRRRRVVEIAAGSGCVGAGAAR